MLPVLNSTWHCRGILLPAAGTQDHQPWEAPQQEMYQQLGLAQKNRLESLHLEEGCWEENMTKIYKIRNFIGR